MRLQRPVINCAPSGKRSCVDLQIVHVGSTIIHNHAVYDSQWWEQIVGVMLLCSMLEINDVVLYCIG